MRKLAAAVMCFAAAAMFAGCSKAEVEETIQPWWQMPSRKLIQKQRL